MRTPPIFLAILLLAIAPFAGYFGVRGLIGAPLIRQAALPRGSLSRRQANCRNLRLETRTLVRFAGQRALA